jgi:RHS repeat-associated protein
MRRGVGVRVFGVGVASLALVAAGLTSVTVAGESASAASSSMLAGVLRKRMDGPEPSVPGAGAPVVRPGPDPDEAVSVGRRPLPAVELPPAATVLRPVEPQASLGEGLPTDGVPVEVAVEPAGVVPPGVAAAQGAPTARAGARQAAVPQGAQVSVTSLGKEPATRLGSGVFAFRVAAAPSSGSAASGGGVRARVDYSGFAKAYGGDFAARLQLWAYPACAVTAPQVEACTQGTLVPATNDEASQSLTAAVAVDPAPAAASSRASAAPSAAPSVAADGSSGVVYALAAGASSGNGNYRATSLSPAGSWAVGEQSGSFSYSYPLPAVPSVGGAAPALGLSYDSGSVDGRTSATNPQASWVGSGWDLDTGYIERQYKPCADDGHATWGDLCWHSPYSDPAQAPMVLSVGGKTAELIWESGNSWRSRDDAGWRVTRLTGAVNGDNDGEYWHAQAPDGNQYWFGRGRQPTTNRDTNSVGTVPVFGDDAGEPTCAANANGYCVQAYRWNLDLTVDANENSTTYFYAGEEQWYSIRGDTTPAHSYIRHVRLARVEYGEQNGAQTATPPARMVFDSVARCTEATVQTDPLNGALAECSTVAASPESYPDVPVDLICRGTCTAAQASPSFFTIYRLNYAASQVWNAALDPAGYHTVDKVQVRSTFPSPGDGTDPSLWLDFVQRRGQVGTDVTVAATNFQGANYANRVDWNTTNKKIMMRRIVNVLNGMGGRIDVTYGRANACPDTGTAGAGWATWYATVNGKWDVNANDCYPVYFDPDGIGSAPSGTGIFHKYLTTRVELIDNVTGSATEASVYTYGGTPAWRHQEDMTAIPNQTWNQWRGYRDVTTQHGTSSANRTVTKNTYFRGMFGDRKVDGTTKTDALTDFRGEEWNDAPSLGGRLLQSRSYDAAGTLELSSSQHRYWRDQKANGPGWHDSNTVAEDRVYTRERVTAETSGGADSWRERQVDTVNNTYGLPTRVTERGDNLASSGDDRCTQTTYAENIDAVGGWNYNLTRPADVRTFHGPCGTGTMTSRVETLYDGAASNDPAVNKPVDGNPTATIIYHSPTETLRSEATYDAYGRLRSTTTQNEVGATTPKRATITYAPSTGYPIDGVTQTNPAGHVTVTYPSLHHGGALRVRDANDRWTHISYDALSRPTSVWLPTEGGTATTPTGPASLRFSYPASATTPATVTTPRRVASEQLQSPDGAAGGTPQYLSSYSYVDGFGRERETQTPSPSGTGRMVTLTQYNNRGLPALASSPQFNSAAAGSGLLNPAVADLTSYTRTDYDDRERVWRSRHFTGTSTTPDRTTVTVDKGNRVETTPARGERTVSYYDAFGRTTLLKKYSSPTASADTSYAYSHTAEGSRVDVTDPHSGVTSFLNDLAGRRWRAIDPNSGTTEYWYDPNGNIVQTRDPAGSVQTDYDVLNRPTVRRSTPPGGTPGTPDEYESARWAYDPPGAKGQLAYADSTTRTTIAGAGSNTLDLTIRTRPTGYDERYRPIGARTELPTSTALGALSGVSYQENFDYDAADHTTTVDYPAIGGLPGETATVGYSDYGTPTHMTLHQGTTQTPVVSANSWTGSGLLDKRFYASGAIRDIDWDESWRAPSDVATYYQPEGQEYPFFWQWDTYTRDAVGNVTSITDQVQTPVQAQCFWYDSWNRLTDARTTNPAVTACDAPVTDTDTTWNTGTAPYRARWAHSANDDITTASTARITGGAAAWTHRSYTRGDSSHPSAVTGIAPSVKGTTGSDTFSYDGAGRIATRLLNGVNHQLTWNPTHQLTSTKTTNGAVNKDLRYAYDAAGQRILKVGTDEVTAYFGNTHITARLTAPGAGTLTGVRHYNQGGATVAKRNGTGPLRYMFDDIQGSASLALDSGAPATAQVHRQRYTPYGDVRGLANQLDTQLGWLGQVEDDDVTGLTYLNARYYDPATTRFISPDPILRPQDPGTLNPYTYARNNPITLSDPTGLEPGSWCNPGSRADCGKGQLAPNPKPKQPVESESSEGDGGAKQKVKNFLGGLGNGIGRGAEATMGLAFQIPGTPLHDSKNDAFDYLEERILGVTGADSNSRVYRWTSTIVEWAPVAIGLGSATVKVSIRAGARALGRTGGAAGAGTGAAEGAAKAATSSCKRSSFDPATPILMADGTTKAIKDVKIGDKVLATNPVTGTTRPEPVTDIITSSGNKDMIRVTVKTAAGTGAVLATDEHPFWNATTKTWTDAEDLRPGAALRTHRGAMRTVHATRHLPRNQTVRNLTVANLHTYYVLAGDTPVLVHNCGDRIVRHGPMNKGPLPEGVANTFRSGTYSAVTSDAPTTVYRVYAGGSGRQLGGYWTRVKPSGPVQSIIDSALDPAWGNTATSWVSAEIPAGTTFYEGAAAAQRGLVGGGNQIFVQRVESSWITGGGSF